MNSPEPTDAASATDEELMRAYVQGSQAAFAALFGRYGERILARMRRSVGETAASDLTQQTFLQLHRSRSDFRDGAQVAPWLMTIARNVLRDHLRRVSRSPSRLPLLDEPLVFDESVEDSEARESVLDAVACLPEGQRVVVTEHWLNHRPLRDVAHDLGISRGAAKVRAHRAYRSLRRVLASKGYGAR